MIFLLLKFLYCKARTYVAIVVRNFSDRTVAANESRICYH
jgi:hypothetical protein